MEEPSSASPTVALRAALEASRGVEEPLRRLGRAAVHHPWRTVTLWLIAILLGAWGGHRLPGVTRGVEGGVPGSPSKRAADALRSDFNNPLIDPLVVAVSAPHLRIDAPPYLEWLRETGRTLAAVPAVRRIESYADGSDERLRSKDGRLTLLLVGLGATTHSERQRAVVAVRASLAPRAAACARVALVVRGPLVVEALCTALNAELARCAVCPEGIMRRSHGSVRTRRRSHVSPPPGRRWCRPRCR